jgi:hypothetical protein
VSASAGLAEGVTRRVEAVNGERKKADYASLIRPTGYFGGLTEADFRIAAQRLLRWCRNNEKPTEA